MAYFPCSLLACSWHWKRHLQVVGSSPPRGLSATRLQDVLGFFFRSAEQQRIFDAIECPCLRCTRSRMWRVVDRTPGAVRGAVASPGHVGDSERPPSVSLGREVPTADTSPAKEAWLSSKPAQEGERGSRGGGMAVLADGGSTCEGETNELCLDSTSVPHNGDAADGKKETVVSGTPASRGGVAPGPSGARELSDSGAKCVTRAAASGRSGGGLWDGGDLDVAGTKDDAEQGEKWGQEIGQTEGRRKTERSCDHCYVHTATGGRVRLLPKEVEAAYVQLHEVSNQKETVGSLDRTFLQCKFEQCRSSSCGDSKYQDLHMMHLEGTPRRVCISSLMAFSVTISFCNYFVCLSSGSLCHRNVWAALSAADHHVGNRTQFRRVRGSGLEVKTVRASILLGYS